MLTRNWIFVLNNYTPENEVQIQNMTCRYVQYGREVAPSTGTPHLQGLIMFKGAKTMSALSKQFSPMHPHFEKCVSPIDAVKYNAKDGDVFAKGEPPVSKLEQGVKGEEYWTGIEQLMLRGEYEDVPASFRIGNFRTYDALVYKFMRSAKLEDVTDTHQWFYGGPRTGKSREARSISSNEHYSKRISKWWDGYVGQDVVIIEDVDRSHAWMLYDLKIWGDRYPFPAEVKGGQINIRPRLIIVTSNFSIDEIFPNPVDNKPLKARFKERLFEIQN